MYKRQGAEDIKQLALVTLGINDTAEVLEKLTKISKEGGTSEASLARELKKYRESLQKKE